MNHTFAGVRFLLETYHDASGANRLEDVVCELLAYAAGAHHGIYDIGNETQENGFLRRKTASGIEYEEAMENFTKYCASQTEIDQLFQAAVHELTPVFELLCNIATSEDEMQFYIGLLCRLLLSSVIEGDRRDTAEFMSGTQFSAEPVNFSELWSQCLHTMEKKLNTLPLQQPIQQARRRISEQCKASAALPPGIYRLNVPTGSGKTLSSLRFALAHALQYEKQRIFFISPLLSILDQNGSVIRSFLQNDSLILEHHSNIIREASLSSDELLSAQELLIENWSAPITITTLVQLLHTLFSEKTACVRRMHALCNRVIIIDEIQTVPTKLLTLFHLALSFLSTVCGTTILLCSATQPCSEYAAHPRWT